jgi:hypothetical protein
MAAAVRSEINAPIDGCGHRCKRQWPPWLLLTVFSVSPARHFALASLALPSHPSSQTSLPPPGKPLPLGKVGSCSKPPPAATIQQPRENRRSVSFLRSPVQKSPEEAECGWRSHESTLSISRSIASQAVFLGFSMGFSAWA